jgi:CheY-like chemotaxis protein
LRERRPMPAIALTGYGGPEVERQTRDAGFNRHLTKPIVFDHLLAAITEATAASVGALLADREHLHADGQAAPAW